MQDPAVSKLERIRRFYKRNNVLFWCIGLFSFGHLFWWNVQQNQAFVSKHERQRYLGPFKVIYLDETDFFKDYFGKKKPIAPTQSNSTESAGK